MRDRNNPDVAVSSPTPGSPVPAGRLGDAGRPLQTDAVVRFDDGPFPAQAILTDGSARSWTRSPVVDQIFDGAPTAQEQASFTQSVLQHVEDVYQRSGLDIQVTDDPSVSTDHTISLVSGTIHDEVPSAIGMAIVGGEGFTYVDQFDFAQTQDELALAVGHNVAHELMHSFGLGAHPDQTGTYLDAGTVAWETLVDPTITFSDEAVEVLEDLIDRERLTSGSGATLMAQQLGPNPTPIPEPATIALWSILGLAATTRWIRRRRTTGQADDCSD